MKGVALAMCFVLFGVLVGWKLGYGEGYVDGGLDVECSSRIVAPQGEE